MNSYITQGMEADDVIGVLSRKSIKKGYNVIVISNDKDYLQLCDEPNLNIYNYKNKIVYHQKNIQTYKDLNAQQFLDSLVLIGDNADNVKGVMKVGEKTAKQWLLKFENLNNILLSLLCEKKISLDKVLTPNCHLYLNQNEIDFFKNNSHLSLNNFDDKLKENTLKNNLIDAINSGVIDRNRQLIRFQYYLHNNIDIQHMNIVKDNSINIKKLGELCIEYKLYYFKKNYIDPMSLSENEQVISINNKPIQTLNRLRY